MVELIKKGGWAGSVVTIAIGATWGLLTYQHQARIAFQKPMVQRTIEFCVEIADVVGRLTDEPDQTKWQSLKTQFWSLYWGRLVLVENQDVVGKMVAFKAAMEEAGFDDRKKLGQVAYGVSLACRSQISGLMNDGWKLDPLNLIKIKN